jgi:ATP-dependent helicase HepA
VSERQVDALLEALADPSRADGLVAEAAALRETLSAELAAGRDRLLEIGSHRPERSVPLVDALHAEDRDPALYEYLCAFWDAFGVDHEPGPGGSTVLVPGRHMLHERFPELPEDGLTVSFDRPHALAHEDRAFLTWEHPMTRAAMELLTNSDLGSAAVLLTRDPRFKAGELLLELLYVAECPAPPELGVGRFLPRLGLRLLLDEQGRDHAGEIPSEAITGKCLTGNRKLAGALLQAKAEPIEAMLAAGEAMAAGGRAPLQRDATARMQTMLDAEIERLTALAEVNPSIRADEIDALAAQRERLRDALGRVHLRLDALRLVVHA